MSKKTFTTAPKPSRPPAESIDAYERGGPGHDRHQAGHSRQSEPQQAESTKRLSLDIPASTHTRFKTACTATGRKMVSEVQEFIERRTAELEDEAGISRK